MVASDRISTYDAVHPTPIPDKGRVLTGLSVLWFGLTRRHRAQPLRLRHRRRAAEVARPRAARAAAEDAAGRVHRARLHHGLGLEGLPGDGHGLGHRAAGRAAGVRAAAGADLHAVDEGRGGPRRGDRLRRDGASSSAPRSSPAQLRDVSIAVYSRGRRARARARRDPRRHEVRVRARRRRRADAGRRGLHAGLLALLAGRLLRGRPRPAVVRQAVRARLGDRHGLGQAPARAADPGRRGRADARALRDGLRAARGRAVRRVAGPRRA